MWGKICVNILCVVHCEFCVLYCIFSRARTYRYGIKRKEAFVNALVNETYKTDHDYNNYKNKINGMITNNDNEQFIKQLFLKPNMVLSIVNTDRKFSHKHHPLLFTVGCTQNIKLFQLLLNCLIHFSETILGYDSETNLFLKEYLNFNKCNGDIIYCKSTLRFWGLRCVYMKYNSPIYRIMEYILELKYFNGLNQMKISETQCMIGSSISFHWFYPLKLFEKYWNKNGEALARGLKNGKDKDKDKESCLKTLMRSYSLSILDPPNPVEWFEIILGISNKSKVLIESQYLKQVRTEWVYNSGVEPFKDEIIKMIDQYVLENKIDMQSVAKT